MSEKPGQIWVIFEFDPHVQTTKQILMCKRPVKTLCPITEVNQSQARLVFGWMTIGRWLNHLSI